MICSKFRDSEWTGSSTTPNDNPVYRYADILLYYAEAVCRWKGAPTDDAMEKLNMVRRRAYGQKPTQASSSDYKLADYASKDAFLALVLQERGYETIFEGKRYNDLKRCGKLAEAALAAGRISALSEVGDAATGGLSLPMNLIIIWHWIRQKTRILGINNLINLISYE